MNTEPTELEQILRNLCKQTTLADRASELATTPNGVKDASSRFQWSIGEALAALQAREKRLIEKATNLQTPSPHRAKKSFMFTILANPPKECAVWPYMHAHDGYSLVKHGNRNWLAHRLMLLWWKGDPPEGKPFACHKCNNPPCLNPRHLYWGSPKDNSADQIAAGTHSRGERNTHAKLTEEQVLLIREDPRKSAVIGREYGISGGAVSRIKKRQSWAWL